MKRTMVIKATTPVVNLIFVSLDLRIFQNPAPGFLARPDKWTFTAAA